MKTSASLIVLMSVLIAQGGCGQSEPAVTQTSEVVVYDDDAAPTDPFDKEFLVDGERALRVENGVSPPRLISRGPRVEFSSSDRNICYTFASIIVVVDKTGSVRQTEIVDIGPSIEYMDNGERREISPADTLPLIEEREPAIRNWKYEPAMKDGQPVPVVVEGGWRRRCR